MINWLLETVSYLLIMRRRNIYLTILYVLVNSCGTPLVILSNLLLSYFYQSFFPVYFLGIEENRRLTREHFQSHMRIFKRNQVAPFKGMET